MIWHVVRCEMDADGSSNESGSDDDRGRNPAKLPEDIQDTEAPVKEHGSKQMAEAEPALQREDWMTKPKKRELTKIQQEAEEEEQREKEERQKQAAEPEIVAGLRVMKKPDPAAALGDAPRGALVAPGGRGLGLVGDGGASWRLKALRRAQEQARAEGRSLQEVVGERWGSLARLTEELTATVAADGRAHLRAAAERRRAAAEGAPPVVPHYLQDVRTDHAKMLRPAEGSSLSWRRDRDPDEWSRRRDLSAGHTEDRGCREEPTGRPLNVSDRGYHARDRSVHDDDRVAERERARWPEERSREECNQERDNRSRREGEGRDSQPSNRGRDGWAANQDDDGKVQAPERDRGREWGRERGREWQRDGGQDRERDRNCGRFSGPGGSSVGSRPSKGQTEALQQLAGSLNTFDDDGSFMERFMTSQGARQQPQGEKQAPAGCGSGDDQEAQRLDDAPGDMMVADPRDGRGGSAGLDPSCSGSAGPSGNRAVAAMLRARTGGQRGLAEGGEAAGASDSSQGGDEERGELAAAGTSR
ncbi:hypothetical protein Vretimale_17328, partial [Volvox reticuliferus]